MSSEILTNLDFLNDGEEWPPITQRDRLKRYVKNKRLFSKKRTIDRGSYNHIVQVMGKNWRVVPYELLLNFYRKISYKTADLIFIEPPNYIGSFDKKNDEKNKEYNSVVQKIVANSVLNSIGHQGSIDASRYGDSVFRIKEIVVDEKITAVLTISQPHYWYPVSDPDDLKDIVYHVLAWKVWTGKEDKKPTYDLRIQVHEKGHYTEITAKMKGDKIVGYDESKGGKEGEEHKTGLDSFAVIPIQSVLTSDTIFGIDDYEDIEDIITELQTRIQQTSRILDKHADPSMSGPSSALSTDPDTGEATVSVGNFFKRDSKEDPDVKYITWDGQLNAAFKEIDLLMVWLSIISEMGSAIFDNEIGKTGNISGRALRMMYINVLNKVARLRNSFDAGFKEAIRLCSQVGYDVKLSKENISIKWNDGLPNDPIELAEIGAKRLDNAASDSIVSQIMQQDGMLRDPAEEKYQQMQIEAAEGAPAFGPDVPITGLNDLKTDDETVPQNIEATKGLNGAQVGAAVNVLKGISTGETAEAVALELLVSLGIERGIAKGMVEAQKKITIDGGE